MTGRPLMHLISDNTRNVFYASKNGLESWSGEDLSDVLSTHHEYFAHICVQFFCPSVCIVCAAGPVFTSKIVTQYFLFAHRLSMSYSPLK